MSFLDRFRRRKEDPEVVRRNRLLRIGRICEVTIIDTADDSSGAITQIFYRYNVQGVEYESSQLLNQEQQVRQAKYLPGTAATIRYDPNRPGNSFVL